MWSRFNSVGMRQRWGTLESDPGRVARQEGREGRDTNGRTRAKEKVKRDYLAGEILIDCPHAGCMGKYVTESREMKSASVSGARIVLKCTRGSEDHDFTLQMPAYDKAEVEELSAALMRGDRLHCGRCETPLATLADDGTSMAAEPRQAASAYHCPWCGVRWAPSRQVLNRVSR